MTRLMIYNGVLGLSIEISSIAVALLQADGVNSHLPLHTSFYYIVKMCVEKEFA